MTLMIQPSSVLGFEPTVISAPSEDGLMIECDVIQPGSWTGRKAYLWVPREKLAEFNAATSEATLDMLLEAEKRPEAARLELPAARAVE